MALQDETPMRRARPRSSGGGGRLLLIFVVAVLVGGAAAWPWLAPRLAILSPTLSGLFANSGISSSGPAAQPSLAERVAALETANALLAGRQTEVDQQILQIEAAMQRIAARLPRKEEGGAEPADGRLAAFAGDLAKLKAEVESLRKLSGEDGGASKLSGAVEKAEAAFRRLADRRANAPLFLMAVGQLREALDRGVPFGEQLRVASALADKAALASLAVLASGASSGIASRPTLSESFKAAADAQMQTPLMADSGDMLISRLRRMAGSLVTIRRSGGGEIGLEGAVTHAQHLLAAGDLNGAVTVLRTVEGMASGPLALWLEAAEQRLAADNAVAALSAKALADAQTREE
ncbi:MAG TPA: hypothetical protein HPP80_05975 [Rhodospirillaceae bacterium]|nr:hypothetical protein [Rhodospirillaceae bacterium]